MKTVGSVELMASMRDELRESNLQKILEALELVRIELHFGLIIYLLYALGLKCYPPCGLTSRKRRSMR
jgi:hypothetical protein